MDDKKAEEKARRVLEAIADSTAGATDEEILEDMRAEGQNPATVTEEVRSIMLRSVTAYKKSRLRAAQEQYKQQVEELRTRKFSLPDSVSAMRSLLAKILSLKPEYKEAVLTALYRDFSELSDEDVHQHLVQLAQLGVLEDPRLREGGD
jgi:DNA-directed RNA polymerase subunit F